MNVVGNVDMACLGEYSWLHWNDRLLAIKSILAGFISMLSDFGIVFSQLCLVPSYIKEFCNLSCRTMAIKMQTSCQILGSRAVERILWVEIGQSREEWVSWNPSAAWI